MLLRRFFSYYKPYKGLFILDFSCAILVALIELAFPIVLNKVIDDILPDGELKWIIMASLLLFGLYIFNSILHFIVSYWGHMLGINIETDMRKESFSHVQKLSFRYFDNNKTGHLVSRLTNDLMDIGELAHHGPEDIFIAAMTIIGTFGVMYYIDPTFTILIFLLVPIILILTIIFGKLMSKAFRQMFGDIADFNARVENNVSGIRVVQAFTNEDHEIKRFKVNNERFRMTKLFSYKVMAWNEAISGILTKVLSLFTLFVGAYFVLNGHLTNGDFIAFILLSGILLGPINKINMFIESYPKGMAGFRRYIEFLETEPEIADRPEAKTIDEIDGEITFSNVSFGYAANNHALHQINLKVRPGETVALVGPSGAGKSTICSLLPRFYEVNEGSIKIDGVDIRDFKLQSLRSHIGIVQQDVFLFDGTIRENIAYGDLNASEEDIWYAAQRAQLTDVINALPEGMDTLIGERGVKLSGGQKQRLSIARIFLKNPKILILDEATSALDTETEQAIQQALNELSIGRTTLVIAHRLATIKDADRIVVVSKKGIIEEGTHEQLMERQNAYYGLYTAQFGLQI
ncbi:ABC transporter ATP-binding protein [Lysinibacillus capsici]|jgi:ATP-binding cassette, subfamily B, bacterial|uniref:ABC transporter ATP-binding protein n=1 Tax=Lysinibacillus capsici TaxID=2115968 RepID=A0A2X0XPA7_9BACI|nr:MULTISPECIES: ABC transporter ATP-binding protein [Lysinibacillus]AUS85312.1 multidrug ABC transporter ATP-binding protein [Lysinibacillus sp. YS11]MCR6523564.1 ABC transporter ATP-binding protein/permease [Lysinibacillus capsici]MCT1539355.1 ABC transporter ATP-binding protein/permease [Lysinibacillus capsici]MCT1570578.1 ABC transporter ATP-binding protein/permease [Lysinibacillus capsici]MCT1647514.1 ABC transporter ATP-binding protein/permease [Lysinibacillus capsici]